MKLSLPLLVLILAWPSLAQQNSTLPTHYSTSVVFDGIPREMAWAGADSIPNLIMIEPKENQPPTFRTTVKVTTTENAIIIGVICYDSEPGAITAISKARDSRLGGEDYIKIVLDTFLDGRSGYIFGVNPFGARYDALVSNFGESENPNWDGIWDAKTSVTSEGWSAEIVIPVRSLSFAKNGREWGFNIERRVQRLLEVSRWQATKRDYKLGQVLHAGRITDLPNFDLGLGLTTKISSIAGTQKSFNQSTHVDWDNSLDLIEKVTPDVAVQITVNTDFAETEVDTRRTNLARFPLFFPEKRTFFLEGSDIYDFGLGLGTDVVPFFSRRIGLYRGREVPILFGTKIHGRVGNTNFGLLASRTESVPDLVPYTTLGALRLKQNIFEESSVGLILTRGDPAGTSNAWLAGVDLTYQTSRLFGDKNFLVGIWGLLNQHEKLPGDRSAVGIKIDYPNDLWDIAFVYKRIGDAHSPKLGFVPRPGINSYRVKAEYMPRPGHASIRQLFFEGAVGVITDLTHRWASYSLPVTPVKVLLESGDVIEFALMPQGERLDEDFEIDENVILKPKKYHWRQYEIDLETSSKRVLYGQAAWVFGGFYSGTLNKIVLDFNWRATKNIVCSFNFERNAVRLPEGTFSQDLFGGRIQFNISSNLHISSFVQYDNTSHSVGTNTRLRWSFDILGDIFVVYNHNINKIRDRLWQYESNQAIVKVTYGWWI